MLSVNSVLVEDIVCDESSSLYHQSMEKDYYISRIETHYIYFNTKILILNYKKVI